MYCILNVYKRQWWKQLEEWSLRLMSLFHTGDEKQECALPDLNSIQFFIACVEFTQLERLLGLCTLQPEMSWKVYVTKTVYLYVGVIYSVPDVLPLHYNITIIKHTHCVFWRVKRKCWKLIWTKWVWQWCWDTSWNVGIQQSINYFHFWIMFWWSIRLIK